MNLSLVKYFRANISIAIIIVFCSSSFASSDTVNNNVLQDLIETIPTLASWQKSNPRLYSMAVSIDEELRKTDGYQDLPTRDRLLIVVNKVLANNALKVRDMPLYEFALKQLGGSFSVSGMAFEWVRSLSPEEHLLNTNIVTNKKSKELEQLKAELLLFSMLYLEKEKNDLFN